MLVKIVFKYFPHELCRETEFEHGQWTANIIKGVKEWNYKLSNFWSTTQKLCCYLLNAISEIQESLKSWCHCKIKSDCDIFEICCISWCTFNHARSSRCSFEDVGKTLNPHRWHVIGIIGFCFIKASWQQNSFKMVKLAVLILKWELLMQWTDFRIPVCIKEGASSIFLISSNLFTSQSFLIW